VFARRFGEDTAETRQRAARVMTGVYALIGLLGVAFLIAAVTTSPVQYKTAVQAAIFLLLGGGGLAINRAARS